MLLIYYDTKNRPKIPDYTDIKLCVNCKKSRAGDSGFCRDCPPYQLCSKCGIHKPNRGKAWCEHCWLSSQLCSCCQINKPTPGHAWCKKCFQNPQMVDLSLPPNWFTRVISHEIKLEEKQEITMDDEQAKDTKKDTKKVVRLLFTSDTHNEHREIFKLIKQRRIEGGDNVLIHTGDWSQMGPIDQTEDFCKWLQEIHDEKYFKHIVIVCGNHERTCGAKLSHEDIKKKLEEIPSVIYLTFDAVILKEFGDLTILGLSWWDASDKHSIFQNFKSLPQKMFSIDSKYERCQVSNLDHINILISHHPPFGILDEWRGSNKGSQRIVEYLKLLQGVNLTPRFHVFGHVHKLGKPTRDIIADFDNIVYVNVAQAVAYYDYTY